MQCVWVILVFLPSALSQRFKLVVPDVPVFGVPGSDVVLPCSVLDDSYKNVMNAEDLSVTWSRSDLRDSLVHLYENRKDLNTDQIPSYRGRTAVFKEDLKNGNASLKLSNVRVSDEGDYICRVDSDSWKRSAPIELSVEVKGSDPVITVEKYESGKFRLLCESKGWHPEPELQWRNSKGDDLTAETENQQVAGLFNMKSRITVEKIDSYSCRVTQKHHVMLGQIDAQTLYEHASNYTGTTAGNPAGNPAGKAVGIIIGVILLVGVVVGVVFYKRSRIQKQIRKVMRRIQKDLDKVRSLMNSDGESRLLHHDLSERQWNYVEFTLLESEEELKEFNLRKYDPSDRGVQKLQNVIKSSTKAQLDYCNLTERSCKVLASVLQSENSKLEELNLSENNLQDSGVINLCDGLKSDHCNLKILRLADCRIEGEFCAALTSALQQNPSPPLRELDLRGNPISQSAKTLNFTFPDLNVRF